MYDSKAGTPLEGFAEFAAAAAAEGAVLLRNDRGMLPLDAQQPVSLFGRTQIDYYRSGTGSGGAVNVVSRTTLLQAMRARSGGSSMSSWPRFTRAGRNSILLTTAAEAGRLSPGISRRCR